MKKKTMAAWLLAAGLVFLAGCDSPPSSVDGAEAAPVRPAVQEQAAAPPAPKAAPLFEGEGGKGIHLAVLEPVGKGLAKDEAYLTNFVQGILTGDLNRVTAMTIVDRQNLDTIIGEQVVMAGVTAEDDAIKIGKITNAQLVLTGELLKTRSGFSLQLAVSGVENAERKASFTANATAAALEDSTAIKDGAVQLLSQLGIHLTEEGKKLLYGVQKKTVEAETALSKGIQAQKGGTVVEALSYYYNAASFDPSLAEAAGRLSVLSGTVAGGNIGQNVRNDIQRRAEWLKIIKEAAAFFQSHKPYEIVYDPTLTEGEVDYRKETVELGFNLALWPTTAFGVLNNMLAGLDRTGKKSEWGFERWPLEGEGAAISEAQRFDVEAALLDDRGKTIAAGQGVLVSRSHVEKYGSSVRGGYDSKTITFTAKANDITDALTVKITKINGKDAAAAGRAGYIQIAAAGTEYKIGDTGPAGGIIFFTMGGGGWRYLEAAPADLPNAEWGALGKRNTAETETRVGSGKRNTELIVAKLKELRETGRAAQRCAEHELNGFKDWFLPSGDELDLMYKNLKSKGLGNFKNESYWSSSHWGRDSVQNDSNYAWYQNFGDGYQYYDYRNNSRSVRAVRAF